jgi:hypothetical protein
MGIFESRLLGFGDRGQRGLLRSGKCALLAKSSHLVHVLLPQSLICARSSEDGKNGDA